MTATWTNADAQGRLIPAEHWIKLSDAAELASAVNRRRRLIYLAEQDFSSHVAAGRRVRASTLSGLAPPPFESLRQAFTQTLLVPTPGGLGGSPPTPEAMQWLWPVAGPDENKLLVPRWPAAGEVGLLEQLNPSGDWTDLLDERVDIRAVHFNELRQAAEWVVRGRWTLPVYFAAGLLSLLPDTPWISDSIANNGADELRSLALVLARSTENPPRGLVDVTVRAATSVEITADTACQVELYHSLRPVDFAFDPSTWNQYDPSAALAWSAGGGAGAGDAVLIGQLQLQAGTPGTISNAALTQCVQAMIDGAEQNFLLRRGDTGQQTIAVSGRLIVEFDMNE